MADGLSVKFDLTPESQARFRRVLRDIQENLKKRTPSLLKQLALFYAQSARKVTKIGKRNREVMKTPAAEVRRGSPPYLMRKYYQDGHSNWIAITGRDDPKREIKKRGAARQSWVGIMRKLHGNELGEFEHLRAVMQSGGRVENQSASAHSPSITVINSIKYMSKIAPGVVERSIAAAQSRLANTYLRKMGDDFRRRWAQG